jgi:hypothetical protein
MKLSIITAILDSHEIVRRQALHYRMMGLPDDVEIIWVDDGSNPPIEADLPNGRIIRTNNTTPWSEHAARNRGVEVSRGSTLFLADIDYILPRDAIMQAREFMGHRMDIRRRLGVLDETGTIKADNATLKAWKVRARWMGRVIPGHRSQFVMARRVFDKIGGYREDLAGVTHPNGGGAGNRFHGEWRRLLREGLVTLAEERVDVLAFPSGKWCLGKDENPSGLFHELRRTTKRERQCQT